MHKWLVSPLLLAALLTKPISLCFGQSLTDTPVQKATLDKAFIKAVRQGDDKTAYSLVKRGISVNTKDPHGDPALMLAAEYGDDDTVIAFLLDHGANVDARGSKATTALIMAAAQARPSTVKLLLERGADPKHKDSLSETALLWATLNPFDQAPIVATVKVLVSHGAEINTCDKDGLSPLMTVTLWGHDVVVKQLLDLGANVNAAGTGGRTALMQSAIDGTIQITKLLLSRKADVTIKDALGKTALDLATDAGNADVVRLLRSAATSGQVKPG